jgi:hypothetical protein
MKYIYECNFIDKPVCNKCMLSICCNNQYKCAAIGYRPVCPDEGCRRDCPLKEDQKK